MRDDLVGSGAIADWLERLERALTTPVHYHVAFAFFLGQVPELTVTGLWHALYFGVDIPGVVV